MNIKRLLDLISKGENIETEFKQSQKKLNKNVYESVCAFLNRNGGQLILGVKDNGTICGVDTDEVDNILSSFVTTVNNPQKLNPTFYLSPEVFEYKDKKIIYIFVPESSQVHKAANKIFDRNDDGDFDITNNSDFVSQMYIRKQTSYSENMIYPYITMDDLRIDLIQRARKLAMNQRPGHPWGELIDFEMLKSAQLYLKDYQTGKEGFTLAGVLLFGKDEVILSVLPHHRTDAILRRKNLDRYDDRDDIRTNLIESYDRLMAFVAKHLPDKFYLEKDQRISLRDHIFREVISNILIHREFINPFPAKLVISPNSVNTENSNKAHGFGLIDPANFSPFPKNPTIGKFFKEIGRADELGSGVRNLFRYCKEYTGTLPQLVEGDIFKTVVTIPPQVEGLNDTVNDTV
ncbi:MAG: putative DNA binding domain-containing protein, partial [Candidatus Cloacimonetes bacterium]|nr:putative DNA binding domain-containing protein [Candidatus Cloacimonadota bacterium]